MSVLARVKYPESAHDLPNAAASQSLRHRYLALRISMSATHVANHAWTLAPVSALPFELLVLPGVPTHGNIVRASSSAPHGRWSSRSRTNRSASSLASSKGLRYRPLAKSSRVRSCLQHSAMTSPAKAPHVPSVVRPTPQPRAYAALKTAPSTVPNTS